MGPTGRELEEYKALRATIRERGTTRVWIVLAGFISWAALTVVTAELPGLSLATLARLLVLAVTFEIAFALHTGVERIGRYIQVFFESQGLDEGWEHRIMAFSQPGRPSGPDPLFAGHFWAAAAFNAIPALSGRAVDCALVGAIHLLFILRVVLARRKAARQRAADLDRFQALKTGHSR